LNRIMDKKAEKFEKHFKRLETLVYNSVAKIKELKEINERLKGEVNELKRLGALSEKKAERMKIKLDEIKANGKSAWQVKELSIKNRLKNLSAKLSAFEKNYHADN